MARSLPVPDAIGRIVREVSDSARRDAATGPALLGMFVETRDESAFRALVQLYAPTVWTVCRRGLRSAEDAEDAFQATFLVLARKADRVDPREKLPTWLYGVALRCTRAVQAASARRREFPVAAVPEAGAESDAVCPDLHGVLVEEVERLPDDLRRAIVLCRIEDKTYAEAAKVLGCSVTTVSDRLGRAEKMLKSRLGLRGLAPAGWLAGIWLARPAEAAVSAPLAERTAEGVLGLAYRSPSSSAIAAAETAIRGMTGRTLRRSVGLFLAVVGGVGVGSAFVPKPVAPPAVSPETSVQRNDRLGDPLPPGALARIGTTRFLAPRVGSAEDVAFLPNRKEVASAHGRSEVLFWDQATGRQSRKLDGPAGSQWVAVDDAGKTLFAAGATEVWAWDLGAAEPKVLWRQRCSELPQASLSALAVLGDGTAVAVGDPAGRVWVLNGKTGERTAVLDGHPWAIAFVGNRYLAASTGPEGEADRILVWELETKKLAATILAPKGETVDDLAASPDGKSLAWLGSRFSVHLADPSNGRETQSWPRNPYPGGGIVFLPDGKTVVEAGHREARFLDPATGKEARPAISTPGLSVHAYIPHHAGKRVSADGRRMATACMGRVVVWDLATGKSLGPEAQMLGALRRLAFSPDGRTLATYADHTHEARLWDVATGTPGAFLGNRGMAEAPLGLGWDADGSPLAAVRVDGAGANLETWDRAVAKRAKQLELPLEGRAMNASSEGMSAFDVSPGGTVAMGTSQHLILRDADGTVRRLPVKDAYHKVSLSADARTALGSGWIHSKGESKLLVDVWDVRTEKRKPVRPIGPEWNLLPFATSLSADGRWLAASARGNAVMLVETASGATGQRLSADAIPRSTAFSPDGRLLAAGDEAGGVTVWDLATGERHRKFAGHDGVVFVVSFSPDGRKLASGGADGTALIWDVGTPRGITDSRPIAARCGELSRDAATAHRASFALASRGERAVAAIAERIFPPLATPKPDDVRRWLTDLDSPDYRTRESAQASILAAGGSVATDLRRALDDHPSPEARARLTWLRDRLDSPDSSINLEATRAVSILESVGTAEARALLATVSRRPGGIASSEAAAALERMEVPARR